MPRIHTAKAAKDYPDKGIKKGDTYYHWAFYRGPKQMSKTPPRRSQTTGSANLSAAYAVEETLEDNVSAATAIEDIASAVDEAVSEAESVIEQFEETISNLEQVFQGGCPAIEEAQEKRDGLETWKDAIESAKSEVEGLDPTDYEGVEGDFDKQTEEVQAAMLEAARELVQSETLDI